MSEYKMDLEDTLFDDSYLDDWEKYEDERVDPNTPQAIHARNIVGKWCEGNTPIYGELLAKVIRVNDFDTGQVRIIALKSSKGLFQIRHWRICGGETRLTTAIGGTWINPTDKRPNLTDWVKMAIATITRQFICWMEHEGKCFKYGWWRDGSFLYHQNNPYFSNILGAFYDFGRAFKYGVFLPKH